MNAGEEKEEIILTYNEINHELQVFLVDCTLCLSFLRGRSKAAMNEEDYLKGWRLHNSLYKGVVMLYAPTLLLYFGPWRLWREHMCSHRL